MKPWLAIMIHAFCAMSCVSTAVIPSPTHVPKVAETPGLVRLPVTLDPVVITVAGLKRAAHRHVLIIGDSEACAVVPYVRRVAEPGDVIDSDCKKGSHVQDWASGRLTADLDRFSVVDDVVIFLGTNHYENQVDTPPVGPILDTIKQRNLGCVWVGNTAVHGRRWHVNEALQRVVSPTCDYFDTEAADIPLVDGIHPTQSGAVKWLSAVWPMIETKYEVTR